MAGEVEEDDELIGPIASPEDDSEDDVIADIPQLVPDIFQVRGHTHEEVDQLFCNWQECLAFISSSNASHRCVRTPSTSTFAVAVD